MKRNYWRIGSIMLLATLLACSQSSVSKPPSEADVKAKFSADHVDAKNITIVSIGQADTSMSCKNFDNKPSYPVVITYVTLHGGVKCEDSKGRIPGVSCGEWGIKQGLCFTHKNGGWEMEFFAAF